MFPCPTCCRVFFNRQGIGSHRQHCTSHHSNDFIDAFISNRIEDHLKKCGLYVAPEHVIILSSNNHKSFRIVLDDNELFKCENTEYSLDNILAHSSIDRDQLTSFVKDFLTEGFTHSDDNSDDSSGDNSDDSSGDSSGDNSDDSSGDNSSDHSASGISRHESDDNRSGDGGSGDSSGDSRSFSGD